MMFLLLLSLLSAHAAPEEIQKWCRALSTDLLSVKYDKCVAHDWKIEGRSVKGDIIPHATWGNPNGKRVLILGSIHGDELSSVSLAFRWFDFLDVVRKESFLRQMNFMIAPLVNPDGYFIRPRTRQNANGVDVNRNFETKEWETIAPVYWRGKAKSEPRRLPGKKAGSEPETKLVQKWIAEFKPDLIISVHAPYGLIDYDGELQFPNEKTILPVKKLGAFPGSLGQYAGIERNIPVITVELMTAKRLPDQTAIGNLFVFLLKAKAKNYSE